MCYSKSQRSDDNRRCDAHKFGTQACVEMSSHIGNVPLKFASKVNADLRKEGKGLPDPSQEEVQQFVAQQVFTAKYDSNIPENRRNTIVKRWRKAQDEKPSGGLMHAWKNNLSESIIRYRRTAMASVLGASIIATSACGSVPPQQNNTPPTPEISVTAPANPSETAKPTETVKPSEAVDNSIAGKTKSKLSKQGIELGDTVKVKGGSYPQYKVDKDSSLAKFDSSKHTGGNPSGWDKSDMNKAQQTASNFMVNSVLDNPTLNDYNSNKETFIKQLNDKIDPQYKSAFAEAVRSKSGSVFVTDTFTDNFAGDTSKGFKYVSDGKTPRIADTSNLKMTSSQVWEDGAYYEYNGTVTMNVVDKANKPYTMEQQINYGVTVKKDKGKFVVYGAQFHSGQYANPVPAR